MDSGIGFYGQVFGEDPDLWKDASPITHVSKDADIPPFLICFSRGMGNRMNPQRPLRPMPSPRRFEQRESLPRSSTPATAITARSTSGSGEPTTRR